MGLSSCQIEEDIPPQDEQFLTESDMKGMTKLGKQLENPYSVENMRKAYATIKSSISTGRIASDEIEKVLKGSRTWNEWRNNMIDLHTNNSEVFVYELFSNWY